MRVSAGDAFSVVGFDVENRPLAYWYDGQATAEITAICWKAIGDDPHVLLLRRDGRYSLDGGRRTLSAVDAFTRFRNVLADAGLVFGHNIRRHDLPIFQAELERVGLPVLPSILTTDTLADYPKRKARSVSLENLAVELELDEDGKKHMGVAMWERANRLSTAGLAETYGRVVGDVLLQERLRDRLLELDYLSAPARWAPRKRAA